MSTTGTGDQSTDQLDYDGNRLLIRNTEGLEATDERVADHAHDGYDRRVMTIEPMGNATMFAYDENSNVVHTLLDGELIDVDGSAGNVRLSEVSMAYDPMDRVTLREQAYFLSSAFPRASSIDVVGSS